MDDVQFVLQASAYPLRVSPLTVPPSQTLLTEVTQIRFRSEDLWHGEGGQVVVLEVQMNVAHFGDAHGIAQRPGDIAKEGSHLFRRPHVVTCVTHAHAVGLPDQGACLHTEQHVVVLGVLCADIVHIAGGDQPQVKLFGQLDQLAVRLRQPLYGVILQFQEVAFGAKDITIPGDPFPGQPYLAIAQETGNLGGATTRATDEPFGMRSKEITVNAGLVVEALQLCRRGDLHQVLITCVTVRQEQNVVAMLVPLGIAIIHGTQGQVRLHADDGLNACSFAGLVELDGSIHCAVVG